MYDCYDYAGKDTRRREFVSGDGIGHERDCCTDLCDMFPCEVLDDVHSCESKCDGKECVYV